MITTIWHNPRCSKSRQTLDILFAPGDDIIVREYLKEPPSEAEIAKVVTDLGFTSARQLMRTNEQDYKDQGLADVTDEAALIRAMAETPKLIERPVVITSKGTVIGRPPEAVKAIL